MNRTLQGEMLKCYLLYPRHTNVAGVPLSGVWILFYIYIYIFYYYYYFILCYIQDGNERLLWVIVPLRILDCFMAAHA